MFEYPLESSCYVMIILHSVVQFQKQNTRNHFVTFTSDIMSKGQMDTIYLAFDTIPHPELLSKLSNYGITGKLWQWLKEYLTNRWDSSS